jgi:hypothetical protein
MVTVVGILRMAQIQNRLDHVVNDGSGRHGTGTDPFQGPDR